MSRNIIIAVPHLQHLVYPLQAEVGANPVTVQRWYSYLFKPVPAMIEHILAGICQDMREEVVDYTIEAALSDRYVDDILSFLDGNWRNDVEEMVYYCLYALCSALYDFLLLHATHLNLTMAPILQAEYLGGNSLLIRMDDGYNGNRSPG